MKRKKLDETSFWPGYVDALVNVVLNVLFFVGLMAVGLVTINVEALSSYKSAQQARELQNIGEGQMLLAALGTLLAALPEPTASATKVEPAPPSPAPVAKATPVAAEVPEVKESKSIKAIDISESINSAVFSVGTPFVLASVKQEQSHIQAVLDKEAGFDPQPTVLEFQALQYQLTPAQTLALLERPARAEANTRWLVLVTVPQVQDRAPREAFWRMSEVRQALTSGGVPESAIQLRTITQDKTNFSNGRRVFIYAQDSTSAKGR